MKAERSYITSETVLVLMVIFFIIINSFCFVCLVCVFVVTAYRLHLQHSTKKSFVNNFFQFLKIIFSKNFFEWKWLMGTGWFTSALAFFMWNQEEWGLSIPKQKNFHSRIHPSTHHLHTPNPNTHPITHSKHSKQLSIYSPTVLPPPSILPPSITTL